MTAERYKCLFLSTKHENAHSEFRVQESVHFYSTSNTEYGKESVIRGTLSLYCNFRKVYKCNRFLTEISRIHESLQPANKWNRLEVVQVKSLSFSSMSRGLFGESIPFQKRRSTGRVSNRVSRLLFRVKSGRSSCKRSGTHGTTIYKKSRNW